MFFDRNHFDAILFDMDGVLTMTMTIHAACWKKMFDEFLSDQALKNKAPFRSFDITNDYHKYVDGRLRYDGVASFLSARGITLPMGTPDDDPSCETVCGLGNRKDRLVKEMIASGNVTVLDGAKDLVVKVRDKGFKTAVVSASKNCKAILHAADLDSQFDCIVDGHVAAELGLAGKPSPDTFLEAARQLNVSPARSVVIEDAISGVEAGRQGNFGLVIGIDHYGSKNILIEHGADLVVESLLELMGQ